MKAVLFTDNLGAGGAQRQLCALAEGLRIRGHDVVVMTYNAGTGDDAEFFAAWLDSRRIPRVRMRVVPRWRRPAEFRQAMRRVGADAVLAFQDAPSLYAEVASLCGRRWGLVVSERGAVPGVSWLVSASRRFCHSLADAITTNSETNRRIMARSWGWLGSRTEVIYNAVDLAHFHPPPVREVAVASRNGSVTLTVVASYQTVKNPINVLRALCLLRDRIRIRLTWYGGRRGDARVIDEAEAFIRDNGLEAIAALRPFTPDPRSVYWDSDAVMLASWHEGCPNVICEAMACGRPVLASRVADHPVFVEEGVSGFLFDPHAPQDIADVVERFSRLGVRERRAMEQAARQRAEQLFDPEFCCARYEQLLSNAMSTRGGRRP